MKEKSLTKHGLMELFMSNKITKWVFLGNEEKYYSEILNLDPEMVVFIIK